MTAKLFSELGLSAEVLKAIAKLGFEQAAPIQAEAIPLLMAGRDIVGQSQTGSGKTAAFAVPAIEKVDVQLRAVQTLILCPTRELAVQVSEEVHKLALFKRGVHALPIYGGQSYERQYYGLQQGAQIVIGTPGRVMDHMRRGTLRLNHVGLVVLDEADVMLDMGFRDDIETILKETPAQRQTVFFSATMPRPIQELIRKFARDPQNVKIEQKALTVPTVEQRYYEVDRRFKIELLTRLIDLHDFKLGIVFCNTKRMVDDLVDHLNAQGYSADRLHGDMTQALRDRVMNKFRKSGLEFLVATDVAARGIDVDDVQVVFNYDLPYDGEDYVHRIGRTGRAGRNGLAISFVSGREVYQIQHIERYTMTRIQRSKVPTLDEVEEARSGVMLDKVRAALASGAYHQQEHLIELLLEEGFLSTDIASAVLHLLQAGDAAPAATKPPESERGQAMHVPRRDRDEERPDRFARREMRPERPVRAPRTEIQPPKPKSAEVKPMEPKPVVSEKPVVPVAPPNPPATPPAPPMPTPAVAKPAVPAPVKPAPQPVPAKPIVTLASPAKPAVTLPPPAKSPASLPPAPKPPVPLPPLRQVEAPQPPPRKASRRTPEGHTRLYINVGTEMGVTQQDVMASIQGETGLPPSTVGTIDVRERHLFVDVAAASAPGIIAKLNRARIKGQKLKVKVA